MPFRWGMRYPVEIIAYHGWGFDQTFWDPWRIIFSEYNCLFYRFDRGYGGHPQDPKFSQNRSKKVVIAHSYGLHLCPKEHLEVADLVIIFNSFIHFHPTDPQAQKLSHKNLKRMAAKFLSFPEVVLNDFYSRCYSQDLEDKLPCLKNVNVDLLFQDLHNLGIEHLNLDPVKKSRKRIIFHSSLDEIVPLSQGQDLFNQVQERSNFWIIPALDHILPLTKTESCWNLCRDNFLPLM